MSPFYRFAARGAIIPFLKAVSRQKVTGTENIPREGGFITVANHLTDLDSLTAMRAMVDADVPVYSLAKSTLFDVPVQELANYSASARESLNRMLSELRKKGIIEMRGHLIFIKDIGYLKKAIHCENCGKDICNIE